jgi:hypothetical protein
MTSEAVEPIEENEVVPEALVSDPVNVLAAFESTRRPLPAFMTAPLPLRTPEKVASPVLVSMVLVK